MIRFKPPATRSVNVKPSQTRSVDPEMVREALGAVEVSGPLLPRKFVSTSLKELERRIGELVRVQQGDSEINECYFEVTILGVPIWERGGLRTKVPNEAEKFAKDFRRLLLEAMSGEKII